MKCEHIAELLPDYLQGRLSAEQRHNVEAHLEQCADCSEEVVIWRKLSLLPVDQPAPASRARFESMLQAYQAGGSSQPEGVTWSTRDQQLDPQVLSALLHTLRCDASVDVRLAALDALSRHGRQPQVHKGILDSLQQQQSPLVQVALIDLLLEWRDPDAAQRLLALQQAPNLNPTVRQRVEWAKSKLN